MRLENRFDWWRFLSIFALGVVPLAAEQPKSVSLCEIFDNIAQWNGQVVRFDAKIEKPGGEQGAWVNGLDCPANIQIKGITFPNALVLNGAKDALEPPKVVDFQADAQSDARFVELMSRVDKKTEYIKATVVGLVETRVPLERLVTFSKAWPNGVAAGFGHLGMAPGQLIIKTTTDMRIEKERVSGPGRRNQ